MSKLRIGIGEDIHKLVPGRKLVLGTVEIPYGLGLEAHSDGDVVCHALSDALLGALALGDIGHYFKVDDPAWDDAPSSKIVEETMKMVEAKGYRVVNVDLLILCEKPHLAHDIPQMRENLAKLLKVTPNEVGIQAGTEEGMGEVGEGKAIRAKAACLLEGE